MKKISANINIVRPVNFIITFFTVIVAAALSIHGEYSSVKVILAAITASLTMSAGNIINDIYDLNGDRINHPGRPLPAGIISPKAALVYYFILLAVSLFLSLFISKLNYELNLLAIILLYLYSYKLKRIAWSNLEYRFLLARRSYLFTFLDAGYYFNAAVDTKEDYRLGFGFGLSFETGLGVLGVSFALGKGDTFSQCKIHFGIINEF